MKPNTERSDLIRSIKNKQQVNNQVSQNASLPHGPLPCKAGKTTGCNNLPCFARSCPSLLQKIAMHLPPHGPALGTLLCARMLRDCQASQ
jgi:hypothetical protein